MSLVSRIGTTLNRSLKPASLALAVCAGVALLSQSMAGAAGAAGKGEKQVDFAKDVQPIFKASCVKCHSIDPKNPKKHAAGGLRLDDKEEALKGGKSGNDIVAGNAKDSLVYQVLLGPAKHGDEDIAAMPKARRGEQFKPIPQAQIETIKAWIDQGAK